MNVQSNFPSHLDYPSGYTYTRPLKTVHSERLERGPQTCCPLFSIIVCTYNRRNVVLAALASLRKQTLDYERFEVIVVDNNSTDGTFNAVQTYLATDLPYKQRGEKTWRARCVLETNEGLVEARQAGIRESSGEIVVFLDDDTIADTRFLEYLQRAYEETGADAMGGRVDLYWEAARPYWLSEDLLDTLGYFAPFKTRGILPDELNCSSSCFSIKRVVLQTLGSFSPSLSKRCNLPINADINDLCRRLRQVGYRLWYEPSACVLHRVPAARLERGYFIGKAYWDGRAEILEHYADSTYQGAAGDSLLETLRSLLPDMRAMLTIMWGHQLLLFLARKPASERIYAAMAQARMWGRIRQQFLLSNHAPITQRMPAVLLVCDDERNIEPLMQGLKAENIHCEASVLTLPFAWMWRYRSYQGQRIGVIHLYNPGAFGLNVWQYHLLLLKLWLAHRLGLLVVSSDNGGWWHNRQNGRALIRRLFEREVLLRCDLIHTCAPIDRLYANPRLRQRAYFHAHPGMVGMLTQLIERKRACKHFGLPKQKSFVYLCFLETHSERELWRLIAAFRNMQAEDAAASGSSSCQAHLLLIGTVEKRALQRITARAKLSANVHLYPSYDEEDLAYAVEVADALVLPYFAHRAAGIPEQAMLFYSYECIVVAPDLPRFQELLPLYASVLFDASSQDSLTQALLAARTRTYHHSDQEARMLAYKQSWQGYARAMIASYRPLLAKRGKYE